MSVGRQIIREFWLPAVVAGAWTLYNFGTRSAGGGDLKGLVNVFGPSFFLVSWATGQFFRVRKQSSVDRSFQGIEQRLTVLLETLEQRTQDLIGYATGGDGVVRIEAHFWMGNPHVAQLSASNYLKYPVFDIQVEWVDLDEPIDPGKGKFWTRHRLNIPNLWPSRTIMDFLAFDLTTRDRLRINIFVNTRGAGSVEQIRIAKAPDRLLIASKWQGPGDKVEIKIAPDFPGYDAKDPDAVFR